MEATETDGRYEVVNVRKEVEKNMLILIIALILLVLATLVIWAIVLGTKKSRPSFIQDALDDEQLMAIKKINEMRAEH